MTDEQIIEISNSFANKNKKAIANRTATVDIFKPDSNPLSVFMAGSPGAGKTETSIRLIEQISPKVPILRIDPDDLRKEFELYNGKNSHLFQAAVSILADKIHDQALKNNLTFIFDGTLANYDKAKQNIERSIKRGRSVIIIYVYQEPLLAWQFVLARAKKDGRKIPKAAFIEQFINSKKTVNLLKKEFPNIKIDLVIKDIDGSPLKYEQNITDIDPFIDKIYNEEDLISIL